MASVIPTLPNQYFDDNGNPLSGGKVYTFEAGTTTPKTTWSDAGQSVANANPIILDAAGRAKIYWRGTYDIEVRNSANVLITTMEDVDDGAAPADALRADLANTADVAKGDALVGVKRNADGATAETQHDVNERSPIFAEQFGAVGDGVNDDYLNVQAALDALESSGGGQFFGYPGKTYRMSAGPVIPENVKVDLQGATWWLNFPAGSDIVGVDMRSHTSIGNGTINAQGVGGPTGLNPVHHCNILIGGADASLTSYTDVRVHDLILTNSRADAVGSAGVIVFAGTNNVTIENLEFPTSSTLACGVRVHWSGNADLSASAHPFNVKVRNIKFGTMTKAPNTDIAGIDIVSGYDISVENAHCERWSGDAFVQVRPGAIGSAIAPAAVQAVFMHGISIKNVTCSNAVSTGVLINGLAHGVGPIPAADYSIPCLIENSKIHGAGSSSYASASGIRVNHTSNPVIRNCECSHSITGLFIEEAARYVTVEGGRYHTNQTHGVAVVHGTTPPTDVILDGVQSYLNAQDGSNSSGFYLESCERVQFRNCTAGDVNTETQFYGFRVGSSNAVGTSFSGVNRVRNVKVGGVKYEIAGEVTGPITLCGGSNAALSTTTTQYAPLSGIGLSTTAADVTVLTSADMVLTNFKVHLSGAPTGATKSRNIRILNDGSVTPLEVNLTDAEVNESAFAAATVLKGTELNVQSQVTNTPNAAHAKWSVQGFLI